MQSYSKRHIEKKELANYKEFYKIYRNVAQTMMCFAVCVVVCALEKKGKSAKYIKDMFEEIVFIADLPEIFGRERMSMLDVMKEQEKKYGNDYGRVRIHIETEKEFIKGCKE